MMRNWSPVGALLMLGACGALPTAAPTAGQVTKPQTIAGQPITVVDIVTGGESVVAAPVAPSIWPLTDAWESSDRIAPGDRLTVTIYEIGYGLFATPGPAGGAMQAGPVAPAAGAKSLPVLTVPPGGAVTLPYIGAVRVAGRLPTEVANDVTRRLRGKSQDAQVVVSADRGEAHGIIVAGDVKQPGRLLLTSAGERVLDAIALAGGPTARGADTIVRVIRGDTVAEGRLETIASDPARNVRLAPGDRIELVRRVRSLTVMGAARAVSEVAFDSDRLVLSEAIARAGGPVDDKADATGVFVFRYVADAQGAERPIIYRLNLLQPQSYFAAQRFQMQPKDVVLIANARSNQLGKVVQLLNSFTSPVVTVDVLTR